MVDRMSRSRLSAMLAVLAPKLKQPTNARVLNGWIAQAERAVGGEAGGGRLGWLVASSVAIAAVQRAIDGAGRRLFLLKGGTLLQHQLQATARTTKDVDGLVRGDLDEFFLALDTAFGEPWGPITLRRGIVEMVNVPTRLIKPRRFDVILELRGVTWRRVQFEVSADEAGIGGDEDVIDPPSLAPFGLPDADALFGIAMRYQIAQKLHAVSDPHEPPRYINDRPRDVVDLLLLRDLIETAGEIELSSIRTAAVALFEARAIEYVRAGASVRLWPLRVIAYPHWHDDFDRAARSAGITMALDRAVEEVNAWITQIDGVVTST